MASAKSQAIKSIIFRAIERELDGEHFELSQDEVYAVSIIQQDKSDMQVKLARDGHPPRYFAIHISEPYT